MRGHPKKIESLIVNDEGETPSLLDPMTGQLLITNQVGKRIVELADGSRDVESIAETVAQEFRGADKSTVLQEARRFLAEGLEKGIVTWPEQA